jgi:FixJ family two-component response regulator
MIRLLIIDDNATFLMAARELILRHRSGFVVDTAPDVETALLAIHRRHYDVVVSDIRLPRVRGLELLEVCRRIQPHTSVIMITGYGDRELEQQATRFGAYAFLHKPVAAEAFCAAVDRAALHSRSRRGADDVSPVEDRRYMNGTEAIHRKSEAITGQLVRPLSSKDTDLDSKWAEEQAESIIDAFLDDKGSDDLLRLKEAIVQALCRAYYTGQKRAATHRSPYKLDIGRDIKP